MATVVIMLQLITLDIQEAEGNDCEARDEDQDFGDEEQGAGEAADEPGISQFVPLASVISVYICPN